MLQEEDPQDRQHLEEDIRYLTCALSGQHAGYWSGRQNPREAKRPLELFQHLSVVFSACLPDRSTMAVVGDFSANIATIFAFVTATRRSRRTDGRVLVIEPSKDIDLFERYASSF